MPSTADFVKKLYRMLGDQSNQHIVCWGPNGDCFVVKDMNEFTKTVLPRLFKHSNFASFVRQLNKYDFHKVKNADDSQFGEQSWVFRHPDFNVNRPDALENIRRKVPTAARNKAAASEPHLHHHHHHRRSSSRPLSPSPTPSVDSSHADQCFPLTSLSTAGPLLPNQLQVDALQTQVRMINDHQDEMLVRVRGLERNYQQLLVEMVGFQRQIAQQDNLLQSLLQGWLSGDMQPPATLMNSVGMTNPVALSGQLGLGE
ncbi:winged helix DNA-binding domain-containing protein [Pluteus cervinus]|uniref:Winged helix DNA-binding domain-containing protein n=1 Tax=Pluteus cervinus TaxID=181527 RepID=A0ACD3ATI3_9AGAR|nr:winged helix DNA-binding domain-containing protein [Pluteus cervinus]